MLVIAVINLLIGAADLLGGIFAVASAAKVLVRGVKFAPAETIFLSLNWGLAEYGAGCGMIAIVGAIKLIQRQPSGMYLTAWFARLQLVEIVASAVVRSCQVGLTGLNPVVLAVFLLYPVSLLVITRQREWSATSRA